MNHYNKAELYNKINLLYPNPDYKLLVSALKKAFEYLPKHHVDKLLNSSVIYIQRDISRRFDRDSICGKSVIILCLEDLSNREYSIPTVLHKSAHEILNHTDVEKAEEYSNQEDEAWNMVREWLPKKFHNIIDVLELEGGGSKRRISNSQ